MGERSSTSPDLVHLLREVHRQSQQSPAGIWEATEEKLKRSRSRRPPVNVGKLERVAAPRDVILVPAKLLAAGKLTKPLTVAALQFSPGARSKIEAAGGLALSVSELIATHGDGKGVRIVA